MDIATKIAILKSRKDKLLSRGFYNFRIAKLLVLLLTGYYVKTDGTRYRLRISVKRQSVIKFGN